MKTCLKIKKTRLIIWYILKKAVLNLKAFLGVGINNIRLVSGFEIGFDSLSKNIYPIILFLKKNTISQCYIITDIICYDYINNNKRYSLVYNIVGLRFNIRIRIRTKLSSVDKLLSLVSLYNSVSWSEREIFDFFGLFFFENRDLRRILTDYGFNGFPLRKDFPVTGYISSYYDDGQKRICYDLLDKCQEYRSFNLRSFWFV